MHRKRAKRQILEELRGRPTFSPVGSAGLNWRTIYVWNCEEFIHEKKIACDCVKWSWFRSLQARSELKQCRQYSDFWLRMNFISRHTNILLLFQQRVLSASVLWELQALLMSTFNASLQMENHSFQIDLTSGRIVSSHALSRSGCDSEALNCALQYYAQWIWHKMYILCFDWNKVLHTSMFG